MRMLYLGSSVKSQKAGDQGFSGVGGSEKAREARVKRMPDRRIDEGFDRSRLTREAAFRLHSGCD